jgi:hypothetical protein
MERFMKFLSVTARPEHVRPGMLGQRMPRCTGKERVAPFLEEILQVFIITKRGALRFSWKYWRI